MTSTDQPTAIITPPDSTASQSGRFEWNQWPLSVECANTLYVLSGTAPKLFQWFSLFRRPKSDSLLDQTKIRLHGIDAPESRQGCIGEAYDLGAGCQRRGPCKGLEGGEHIKLKICTP